MTPNTHIDFIKHVSRTSAKAYMLVTIDPDTADTTPRALERALVMLSAPTIDILTRDGGTIVIFDTIDEAINVYHAINQNMHLMPHVEFDLDVFFEGENLLTIKQENDEFILPASCAAAAHVMM